MTAHDSPRDELVGTFGQVVGVEKAEELVESAVRELGLQEAERLSAEAVIDVCETIERSEEGYLAMLAGDLKVQTQSNRRFNALLANVPDPTVVVTLDEPEPRVKTVNPAFETTFGYDYGDAEGEPLASLIRPEDPRHHGGEFDSNRLATGRIEAEVRRVVSDGSLRDFFVRSVSVSTMSGDLEAAIIYTDITEQKRRQQELERQNEQLEQFAQTVSHDLRNPLNVALGRLDLARAELDSGGEHVDAVGTALDRMERLIDDLLTLARQGQTVGRTEQVSLAPLAARAWDGIESGNATVDIEPDLPRVTADPQRLQEALENLFRNAVEHGGRDVTVRVGRSDGGFYVADDGPGFPAEDRADVFEHGYTTDRDGTGFGLSIVRSIVEAHGWSIVVADDGTPGARLDVRIPAFGGQVDGADSLDPADAHR